MGQNQPLSVIPSFLDRFYIYIYMQCEIFLTNNIFLIPSPYSFLLMLTKSHTRVENNNK